MQLSFAENENSPAGSFSSCPDRLGECLIVFKKMQAMEFAINHLFIEADDSYSQG
jgi:hypothetical protein